MPRPSLSARRTASRVWKALAVGDAGQRVFFGQALQGVFQYAALAHMPQAAAQ
jgi:hypothetical protein